MSENLSSEQTIVVVDIDGVLFDTPGQAVARWNGLHGTSHSTTDIYDHNAVHDKVKFRHYHEDGSYDEDNGQGRFDDGFYDGQKDLDGYIQMPGAKDALTRLRARGAKIIALTSRDPEKLRESTLTAIDSHFGIGHDKDGLIDEVLFAGDPDIPGGHSKKSDIMKAVGGHILIDDAVRYVEDAAAAHLLAILLAQPYNKEGHSWPPEKTADTWAQAELLIEQELGWSNNDIVAGPAIDTVLTTGKGEKMKENPDLLFTIDLINTVGEQVRSQLRTGTYGTNWKPDNTPVTDIDISVNQYIIDSIHRTYPEDRVFGEEASLEGGSGFTWIVDPIDGTQALGIVPTSTTCIARTDTEGQPLFSAVYNPLSDELFVGAKNEHSLLNGHEIKVSSKSEIKGSYVWFGSRLQAGLASNGVAYDRLEGQGAKILNTRSLAYGAVLVAAGRIEGAYIGVKTPFEAASVKLIVEGAGGKVTDLWGNDPGRLDGEIRGLVVSNGLIHESLLAAIQKDES